MSRLDELIAKVKDGSIEFKAPARSVVEKKQPAKKSESVVAPVNMVPEKHIDEIREMFHFLMFKNRMKKNEQIMIGPMYSKFCETGKLSPAQRSFVAGLWIRYQ